MIVWARVCRCVGVGANLGAYVRVRVSFMCVYVCVFWRARVCVRVCVFWRVWVDVCVCVCVFVYV